MSFRNWRVRTRLAAILVVPAVAGLAFAGLRVTDEAQAMSQAGNNQQVAKLVNLATTVVDDLENERDSSVQPLLQGNRNDAGVIAAQQKTDEDIAALNDAARSSDTGDRQVTTDLAEFAALQSGKGTMKVDGKTVPVPGLQQLRAAAYTSKLPPQDTQLAYSAYFWPLMAMDNELYFGANSVNSRGRELYALTLAKASYSTERNLVMIGLVRGHFTTEEAVGVQVANKLTETAMNQYQVGGIPADLALYDQTVNSPDIAKADQAEAAIGQLGLAGRSLSASGVTPEQWYRLASARFDLQRQVETQIVDSITKEAADAQSSAELQMIINAAGALIALIVAFMVTGAISRSLVRGMRTLRSSAQDIAAHQLPALVRQLSETTPERVDTKVTPIPLSGKDEIGEVARAFDDVHRQAVRLASEQALLRGNVNAIFSNLSRRTQGLIERQLQLITDLENNEADPEQLENLFRLDHLATRMRRNGENLLVLAGEEPGRQWDQPIPLVDVLRAAASEVEEYERIELSGIPETDIVGPAVNDLVHLLAELLENAISFSSPQTRVRVNAARLPDQRVLIEIHDKGIGLSAEDFTEINAKLAAPSTLDASVSRQMGLYVVGRLASRHGVRVQLRASTESTGTTSLVMLPDRLTQASAPAPQPEEEFTVSRIVGEAGSSAYADPSAGAAPRSANELGFDESHWGGHTPGGVPDGGAPALDPVQRSLDIDRRRRASLELESGAPSAAPAPGAPAPGSAYPGGYGTPAADETSPFGQQAPYAPEPQQYPAEPQGGYAPQSYDTGAPSAPARRGSAYPTGYETAAVERPDGRSDAPQSAPYGSGGAQNDSAPGAQGSAYPSAPTPYGREQGYGLQQFEAATAEYSEYGNQPAPSYYGEPQSAPLPDSLGSLPTRRPGQTIDSGHGIGSANPGSAAQQQPQPEAAPDSAEDRPNWFTGGRAGASSARGAIGPASPSREETAWQTPSDSSWQRAASVQQPASGGTTSAGLPMRVPKQNLVPGNAPASEDYSGPQVSRTPDQIRGRLSSLRRGVEQGRTGGAQSSPASPDQPGGSDFFGGPHPQER